MLTDATDNQSCLTYSQQGLRTSFQCQKCIGTIEQHRTSPDPDIYNEIFFDKSTIEKLLLVADPQLIDEKDEDLFGLITRKDGDSDKQPILRQRFRNYFGRTITLYRQNDIEYLKLDIDMLESYVDDKRVAIMKQTQNRPLSSIFRIVLNHWPSLTHPTRFVKRVINELESNLILKGDSHHFYIFAYDRINMTNRIIAREYLPQSIISIDLDQKRFIYEISISGCSYRMGVNKIGYIVLLLDSATKMAHLAIFPTPRRYISLYLYAAYWDLLFD
ncbi:unnamed protein product [Rotaria sordida]|uniref:Uncharacterized protein n=2 Tax=Rotaria sordida TaxID=392033 RepID=A0A815JZ63_9BILA|nr:unnamed protein product [Rotaria sordida]